MFQPVIMAGGSGTRLWPLSRQLRPKQFLSLGTDSTLFQKTLLRLNGLSYEKPIVICNEEHRFLAAEQLREIGARNVNILLEPVGRNTAPAIALAALQAVADNSDSVLLVLAADHFIENHEAFHTAIQKAIPLAESGRLVTFGIVPAHPETGYGYIERGAAINDAYEVARFVEKPDLATAESYLKSEKYYWNSGMFLFQAKNYLVELEKYAPEIYKSCKKSIGYRASDMDFVRVDKDTFLACPEDSIDYAVMEKTDRAAVIPLDAGWSDVGSWSALWDVKEHNDSGNSVYGDVILHNAKDNLIHAESRLVAAVGVDNLAVVETSDAVLVVHKDQVQDVKKIVEALKSSGRSEHIHHREVYRPWGKYDSIDHGERYQVKRITVNPGAKLSVQMHHHRAEHWIVVSGTAKVTRGEDTFIVSENQSTYIPVGEIHALENPGKIPLELIEIQSGSYLGEDDIVRYNDLYGRV